MKFRNIEVSGIKKIVFNGKKVWEFVPAGTWVVIKPEIGLHSVRSHTKMMAIVNRLKEDRRYRMWVHGDTLNIARRYSKEEWCCMVCGKCSQPLHDHTTELYLR